MYSVEFSKTAERQLFKLEKHVQERILFVLERIKIRPFRFVAKLSNAPYFRLRIGDYRAILDINQEKQTIFVAEVGHRRNIYHKF